jgi:hypothetical protein
LEGYFGYAKRGNTAYVLNGAGGFESARPCGGKLQSGDWKQGNLFGFVNFKVDESKFTTRVQ